MHGGPPMPAATVLAIERASSPVIGGRRTTDGIAPTACGRRAERFLHLGRRDNEIDVLDKRGKHLGVMDPMAGVMIKRRSSNGETFDDDLPTRVRR